MNRIFRILPLYFITLSIIVANSNAQAINGIPIIQNFKKSEYKASTQNWSICQGSEGFMYFGNNQGVLQYNGYDWQLVEMSNYSIVRTVKSGGKDSILIGAFNELGLLSHDKTGKPQFSSWNERIPSQYRNYGEIWRIHVIGNLTYFQSFKSILIFRNGTFFKAITSNNEYRFSYLIDNVLYVYERNRGLLKVEGDGTVLIEGGDFFKDKEVWFMFRLDNQNLLIGTQYNGLFTLRDGKISVWNTPVNQQLLKHTLFDGVKLSDGQFAFGTVMNGLVISDISGNVILSLNKQNGIQNNTVLSLFEDNLKNIWLGLDNGIDYIKTNIPLSFVRKTGGFGTGYCSIVYNNTLFAGTNQGLFMLNIDQSNKSAQQNEFSLVPNTAGQVWGLFNINGVLLCGHNSGLFLVKNGSSQQIFDATGVWNILAVPNESNLFIMGTYYGFYLLRENQKNIQIVCKISGFEESARRFFFDKKGFLWMSHGYKGIYQLKLSSDYKSVSTVKIHNSSNDLPFDYSNEVSSIRNHVIATTESGIYDFSYDDDKFIYDSKWETFFNGNAKRFTQLIEVGDKKIWAFKRGSVQLLTYLNDKIYDLITRPFLLINNTLSGSYENVLTIDKNRYLLGTEDGFVLYNDTDSPQGVESIPLSIEYVESIGSESQLGSSIRLPIIDVKKRYFGDISYRKRHLSIKLSMPFFASQDLVKFRYKINKGEWCNWLIGNTIDLTGLTEGDYKVDVQCSIDEKEISGKTNVSFKIIPPIHRTWYAFLFYLICFAGLIYAGYSIVKIRVDREKRKEFLVHRKKMIRQEIKLRRKAQEAENELNVLKNEKLQADIIYKSKELANTTMGIIQKNIILGDIKDKLQELINESSSLKDNSKIHQLLRKINKGIEQKDEWKVFEQNFDQVHENFILNLKEKHPDLTAKDMRLAAYIRMNLSSKEIAPLMNISVRSVEISRYRLRKKINIEHDQNLYDYLINL